MENAIHCDYCDDEIDGDPEYVHEGNAHCCDPCYDEAVDLVRAADAHDAYFGFDVPFDR